MLTAIAFASKLLLYAAALGSIGLALHDALGISRRSRLAAMCAIALILGALLRLLLTNAQMGGGLSDAFSLAHFNWAVAALGPAVLAWTSGAALLLIALSVRRASIGFAAAVAIAAGFGLTGHTPGLQAPGAAPFLVMLHVLIAGFWMMAPLTLWPHRAMGDDEVLRRTRVFSRYAVFVVPVLFASGLALLWQLAGGPDGVVNSAYGRLLVLKLVFASVILGLGALNKLHVTGKLETEPVTGRRWLSASLLADTILFLLIIGIIAMATTFTGPPELGD